MLTTIIAAIVLLSIIFYQYFRKRNSFFDSLNVKGPTPALLFGNLGEFWGVPIGLKIQQWTQKYGKVYGYYEGGTPVLVTSDLDILHDVFVKQFDSFHGRKLFPLQPNPDDDIMASIFMSRGMRWKRLRTIANPVFSVANLKRLLPTCEVSVDNFMEIMDERCQLGKPFDIHPYYQQLTCDVIARVAFGEERDLQRDPNNPYIELCRELFPPNPKLSKNIWNIFAMILPELRFLAQGAQDLQHKMTGANAWFVLTDKITKIVDERRLEKDGVERNIDFIQLFLEAESEDAKSTTNENKKLELSNMKVTKKLTTQEIVGQLTLFLVAGYDTTSNSLSYITYELATHPEVQEKLRAEIDEVCSGSAEITYEQVSKLKYAEQVIKETLRLYPLASLVQARLCMSSMEAGDKLKQPIPQGLTVAADVWSVHRDKTIWGDDADQFRPERFDEEVQRHPMAWFPFGTGPRICIGLRFTIIEQKIALTRMLQRFVIKKCAETLVPLRLCGAATVCPESVDIVLEPRTDI
uniref:Cytochrome P450 n=1 Tax=Plectus sambesii TaxID=2011161 RepID=A0A914X045_9BILA